MRAALSSRGGSAATRRALRCSSSLAGIAVSFIALGFFFKTFAAPLVGIPTLAVISGRPTSAAVRFAGGAPGGLVAVTIGALLCGSPVRPEPATRSGRRPSTILGFSASRCPSLAELMRAAWRRHLVTLPVGHRADGPVQRDRLAAEHRVCRSRRRPYPTAPAARQRHRLASRPRCSAAASRPRSTSATRAGRRSARASATRS